MKASELRLGNWIYNGIGEEFQANGKTINHFNLAQTTLGGLTPIPLTEDWLEKFGFEEHKLGGSTFHVITIKEESDNFIQKCTLEFRGLEWVLQGKEGPWDNEQIELPYIQHVHQLQNLYFALTHEELTLS